MHPTHLILATFPFQNLLTGLALGIPLFGIPLWFFKREIDGMLAREKEGRRSPFSQKLLRPAGESLRLEISEIRDQMAERLTTLAMLLVGPGFWALVTASTGLIINLTSTAIVTAICFGLVARKLQPLKDLREQLRRKRLGFDGERYVAAELEPLIARGYRVFHDFIFDMKPGGDATTFNIDHIAVGPEGVFVIETKTRRKPTEAGPDGQEAHNVIVSDNTLRFPNGEDRKAIKQAQLQAKDLADWLNGPSSTRIPVTPVVALPGWFVKDKPGSEVAVRSGRNIAMSIPKLGHEAALSPTQVRQIAHQIDKHCRDIEGE